MVAARKLLGVGLYSVAEAAFYARMHPATLHSWLFGSPKVRAVLSPEHEFGGEKLVSFISFVEAMAVRAIRLNHKVPLDRIRQAVQNAERKYEITHLLARRHTAYFFNKDIYIAPAKEKPIVQVSGKHVDSQLIPVLELQLNDIGFDANGLAEKYRIFKWENSEIWMNPRVGFGEPLLPSGYSVVALWNANQVEGSVRATAKANGVSEEEVNLACRCYDHLVGPAAA